MIFGRWMAARPHACSCSTSPRAASASARSRRIYRLIEEAARARHGHTRRVVGARGACAAACHRIVVLQPRSHRRQHRARGLLAGAHHRRRGRSGRKRRDDRGAPDEAPGARTSLAGAPAGYAAVRSRSTADTPELGIILPPMRSRSSTLRARATRSSRAAPNCRTRSAIEPRGASASSRSARGLAIITGGIDLGVSGSLAACCVVLLRLAQRAPRGCPCSNPPSSSTVMIGRGWAASGTALWITRLGDRPVRRRRSSPSSAPRVPTRRSRRTPVSDRLPDVPRR